MNRIYVGIFLVVAVAVTVFIVLLSRPSRTDGSQVKKQEPADIVSEYWETSRRNDVSRLETLLTDVPREFSAGLAGCEQAVPELASTSEPPNQANAVAPSRSEGWINSSKEFSRIIYDNKLVYRGSRETKVFGENAILHIAYADAGSESMQFFLLNRVDGSWKIFMITDGYAVFNKNFGECS